MKRLNNVNDWTVYLLRCSDDSLYCGVTNNLDNRLEKHQQGTASKYTRSRLPVKLAAVKASLSKKEAYKLEYRVKRLPSNQKIRFLEAEV